MSPKINVKSFVASAFCLLAGTYGCKHAPSNLTLILTPPEIITALENRPEYQAENRKFTGIPSIAVTTDGQMWATWYAGSTPDEDSNNYIVVATAKRGAGQWEERLIVDPDGNGPVRAYDPELWLDPDGKLWLFWTQNIGHEGHTFGVWSVTIDYAEGEQIQLSAPRRLADGVMMCKPTVLANGDWLFPISTWRETNNSAKVYVSKDRGRTLTLLGAANVPVNDRVFDEHIVVERKDGSLWMLVRTSYGIGESFSTDGGATWTEVRPSAIRHPSARFFIGRLQSGRLLLVKHGEIDVLTDRSQLMAFLSDDDGKTWLDGMMIFKDAGVSYPDAQQTADGQIHLVYDYDRTGLQHILYSYFTEADILSPPGNPSSPGILNPQHIVSAGGL